MLRLDRKDRNLLYQLDINSRQSASKIGKIISLSKEVVNYRIKRLLEAGIINKFMTLMNTANLGVTTYKIFYRFQNTTPEIEREIINYLTKHQNTQLVTDVEGMYDLNINIIVKTPEEFNDILSSISKEFGYYFANREVLLLVKSNFFFRDYLIQMPSNKTRKPMYFGSKPEEAKVDPIDKKILSALGENARTPIVDIAKLTQKSPDAIALRIKRLEKLGIIQSYVIFLNPEQSGFIWNYVLLTFNIATEENEKLFFEYCKNHPNIWFYSRMIGNYDAIFNIDTEDHETFKKTIIEIKRNFSKLIKNYITLQIYRPYKFNMFPQSLNKSL